MLGSTVRVFALRVVVALATFVADVVLARGLGPEYKGYYYTMTLIPILLSVLAIGGQDYAVARFARRGSTVLRAGLWRGLFITTPPALILALAIATLPFGMVFPNVPVALAPARWGSGFLLVVESGFAVIGMYCMSTGGAVRYAAMRVVRRGVFLGAAVICVNLGMGRPDTVLGLLWCLGTAVLVSLLLLGDFGRTEWRSITHGMWQQIRSGLTVLPGRIGERALARISPIVLAVFAAGAPVGHLSVANGISELLYFVSGSLAAVLFGAADRNQNRQRQIVRVVAPLLLLLALVTGALAQYVVPALYGEAFRPSVVLVWLALPGTFAMSVVQIVIPFLVRQGRMWAISRSYAIAVVATVAASLILSSWFHANGAAIAATLGSLILLVLIMREFADGVGSSRNWLLTKNDMALIRSKLSRAMKSRALR